MNNTQLGIQKRIVPVFEELYNLLPQVSSKVSGLGWKQRNELVTHVYSNYNNFEKLNAAKEEWEAMHTQHNVLKWLLKLLTSHRDLYGFFTDYDVIIEEIETIIDTAVEMEKYEIAGILNFWKNKLEGIT